MGCRSCQSPVAGVVLVALFTGGTQIAGCGGPSPAGQPTQSGHRVDMNAMLADAQAKLKSSKSGRRQKPYVIEFPSRGRD